MGLQELSSKFMKLKVSNDGTFYYFINKIIRKTWKGKMIKNVKRREECNTYLTHVCRYHWSRKSPVKR